MFKAVLSFIVLCFAFIPSNSQTGVPIFIKGKVLDEFTKQPVKVEMMFTSKDGKKFKISPNILTGTYEQILNSGEDYDVTFISYDVVRETQKLQIEYSTKYVEIEHDFIVKRMTNGLQLYSSNVFTTNSPSISQDGKELLDQIVKTMRFSRGAKIEIKVAAKDSDKSQNAKELIEQRIKAISDYKGLADFSSRISILVADSNFDKNFTVIVTEISDPLKN